MIYIGNVPYASVSIVVGAAADVLHSQSFYMGTIFVVSKSQIGRGQLVICADLQMLD